MANFLLIIDNKEIHEFNSKENIVEAVKPLSEKYLRKHHYSHHAFDKIQFSVKIELLSDVIRAVENPKDYNKESLLETLNNKDDGCFVAVASLYINDSFLNSISVQLRDNQKIEKWLNNRDNQELKQILGCFNEK